MPIGNALATFLHFRYQQVYCPIKCGLYQKFDGSYYKLGGCIAPYIVIAAMDKYLRTVE